MNVALGKFIKIENLFSCQVHKLSQCLYASYGMNRTLVINTKSWAYSRNKNHENCLEQKGDDLSYYWNCFLEKIANIDLPSNDLLNSVKYTGEDNQK
jgi:hypothetical protein